MADDAAQALRQNGLIPSVADRRIRPRQFHAAPRRAFSTVSGKRSMTVR
jgi:hypothetical protein